MADIRLESIQELDEMIKKESIKNLGCGREGSCFLLSNDVVMKKLYDDYNPEFALQFKDLDIKSFVFATSGVYIKNYIRAIFMKYINGETLITAPKEKITITDFSKALQQLVEDVKKISEMGILMRDFHCGNIIYDGKDLKIIDTMCYLNLHNSSYFESNIRDVILAIYRKVLNEILHTDLFFEKYNIFDLDVITNPIQFFSDIKRDTERASGEKVETIADVEKVLKKISQ